MDPAGPNEVGAVAETLGAVPTLVRLPAHVGVPGLDQALARTETRASLAAAAAVGALARAAWREHEQQRAVPKPRRRWGHRRGRSFQCVRCW